MQVSIEPKGASARRFSNAGDAEGQRLCDAHDGPEPAKRFAPLLCPSRFGEP